MLQVPDLFPLVGSSPTFDAQALQDNTDLSTLGAAHQNLGVNGGSNPAVVPCTATVTGPGSTTLLSSLTGSTTLTVSGIANGPLPTGGGYFLAPTTGGGSAMIGYASSNGTTTFVGCFYISGGSGSISASATLSVINAITVPANFVAITGLGQQTVNSGNAISVSLKNIGGTAFQAIPQSTTDRKDMLVLNFLLTPTIVQGTPCGTLDWSRNTGNYATPAPVKPAYSLINTSIILTEIYVPGATSAALPQNAAALAVAQLTDKTVGIATPILPYLLERLGTDFTVTTANTEQVAFTSGSIPIGTYLIAGQVEVFNSSGSACTVAVRMQPTASGGITASAAQYPGAGTTLAAGAWATLPFNGQVVVSAAGTVDIRVQATIGSSGVKVKSTDEGPGWADVTSFVLTRIG